MPTDVSGTIHIIAEVMGDAASPLAGTGNKVANSREKRTQKRFTTHALGFELDMKKVVKYLTVGGLIANSRNIQISTSWVFRWIGILVDLLIAPFAPILFDTLLAMFKVLTYISLIMEGEKGWSDIWADFKAFWTNQWNTVGFVGILKGIFKGFMGITFLTTLFAGMLLGPGAGKWVLGKMLKTSGIQFTVDAIRAALGMRKPPTLSQARKGTRAMRTGRAARRGIGGLLSTVAKGKFSMIPYIFSRGAHITKPFLSKALGLTLNVASIGMSLFGGAKWKSLVFGPVKTGFVSGLTLLGFAGLGGALATIGLVGLILGIAILALVSAAFLANWLVERYTGKGILQHIGDWWQESVLNSIAVITGGEAWRVDKWAKNFLWEITNAMDPNTASNRNDGTGSGW